MTLLTTLHVLENILKDTDDVIEVKNIIINETHVKVQKTNQSVTEVKQDVNKNFDESFGK